MVTELTKARYAFACCETREFDAAFKEYLRRALNNIGELEARTDQIQKFQLDDKTSTLNPNPELTGIMSLTDQKTLSLLQDFTITN